MTPADVTLIKGSFQKLVPIADQAAALFYARLFDLDPGLRAQFRGDMLDQAHKLMSSVAITVAMLDRVETVLPFIRELWSNRGTGPLSDPQIGHVGEALLWTLQKILGADFTPETREAWTKAYVFVAHAITAPSVARAESVA